MFAILFDTQRAALTIIAFVGTFVVALSIGRVLKRRAGVQFGVLFREWHCDAYKFETSR